MTRDVESVESLAKKYFLPNNSLEKFSRGCWTDLKTQKLIVVKARPNLELNRRGDRVVECIDVLAITEDESYFPVDYDDVFHQYMLPTGSGVASPISAKSERHLVFSDWIVKTFGSYINEGGGVLDVAG